jgi:ADP-ribosylglycohydrolase
MPHGPVALDPGPVSDDTQLTLATCEAITRSRGRVQPSAIAARFAHWWVEGRITGIGVSTLVALEGLASGRDWKVVGNRGEMAAGNGAAMRIAPLAFVLDPAREHRRVGDVARITHANEEATAAALAVAQSVRLATQGRWRGGAAHLAVVAEALPVTQVRQRLLALSRIPLDQSIPAVAARHGTSGWCVESVPLALLGATRYESRGFLKVIEALIRAGGDTDTTASMAGQIVGTAVGADLLPRMVRDIPGYDEIDRIATELANVLFR